MISAAVQMFLVVYCLMVTPSLALFCARRVFKILLKQVLSLWWTCWPQGYDEIPWCCNSNQRVEKNLEPQTPSGHVAWLRPSNA